MKPIDLDLPPPPAGGLILTSRRASLASRLFEISVDLEAVMERKKVAFRTELKTYLSELEDKKRRLAFSARVVASQVEEDEPTGGVRSAVMGVFGYERRVTRTRQVTSKQVRMADLSRQIDLFVNEAVEAFEKMLTKLGDVEATIQESTKLASDRLYDDEYVILKVAIRRSFSKIDIRPFRIRFEGLGEEIVEAADQIQPAIQRAKMAAETAFQNLCSKAHSTRRRFEREMDRVLQGLSDELVRACLERKKMEEMLQMALLREHSAQSEHLLTLPRDLSMLPRLPLPRRP
ncbi:hypothetical protein K2X33_05365 [bacterium]|nr:hypothetical protein [bacterium]